MSNTDVLVRLLDGPATREDLGLSLYRVNALASKEGVITKGAKVVRTGQRGRPSFTWRLTNKGRSRAKRLASA